MNIYAQAIQNVKAFHLKTIEAFLEKNFPELTPDPEAIKADFERYFNAEAGALTEEQLIEQYGQDEFGERWTRRAQAAERQNARTE